MTSTFDTLGLSPDEVAVETMEVYDQRWWKGNPADVLEVQGVAACVGMYFRSARLTGYLPKEWKRQVPTDVMAHRIEARVTALGWRGVVVEPKSARRWPDLWHGVGVGLHHLGIMRAGRSS